jgi:hypothetical protein
MTSTKRKEAQKAIRDARLTFRAGPETPLQGKARRDITAWLEPIRENDNHLIAIAKHSLRLYMEETGENVTPDAPAEVIGLAPDDRAHGAVMRNLYTWYLCVTDAPCYGRDGERYIPSPEELDTVIPNIGKTQPDGSVAFDLTLREILPEIPPGWEEIMLRRRAQFPEYFAVKRNAGD